MFVSMKKSTHFVYTKKRIFIYTDEHIGCSRDTSFEEMVMQHTNGEGVNIILNSLADDKLQVIKNLY